jgi:hypothetical protein
MPAPVGDLSPFARDLGTEQGRILVNGNWVYELGHASREGGTLNVGDYVEVSQAIGTPDPNAVLLRTDVDVVLPDELPTSPVALEWEFTARLNGTPRYTRKLGAGGRTMALRDIAVSLANSSPPDTVAFRLEVVLA